MKTTDFTLDEAVSICAFYTSGSDGDFDEKELKVIQNHPFFVKHSVTDHLQLFLDLTKSEGLNDVMENEFPKVFESCDESFKRDYVNAITKIILADGEIEEGELTLLNFTTGLMNLSPEEVNEIIRTETERLKAQNKEMKAKNSEGCFIATATMGDYDNPLVLDFRNYRDNTLQNSMLGRLFIRFYYKIAPYPASIIAKSRRLRSLSLKYLITPLHRIIK